MISFFVCGDDLGLQHYIISKLHLEAIITLKRAEDSSAEVLAFETYGSSKEIMAQLPFLWKSHKKAHLMITT